MNFRVSGQGIIKQKSSWITFKIVAVKLVNSFYALICNFRPTVYKTVVLKNTQNIPKMPWNFLAQGRVARQTLGRVEAKTAASRKDSITANFGQSSVSCIGLLIVVRLRRPNNRLNPQQNWQEHKTAARRRCIILSSISAAAELGIWGKVVRMFNVLFDKLCLCILKISIDTFHLSPAF